MPEAMLEYVARAVAPARAEPRRAEVGSVGVALPEAVVENAAIAAALGVSEQWIVERTGILERRRAEPHETVVDYAAAAASRALDGAGVGAAEIDLVLFATMTNQRRIPNAAPVLAERLGAAGAGAVDLGAACAGFVSGLALAAGQIEARRAESVLVVGADLLSRVTDRDDRRTAALFGDGAGAAVVRTSRGRGWIGPAVLGSDGARAELISTEGPRQLVRMNGHDTFRHAVDRLCEASLGAAAAAGVALDEIDLFAYHQANGRILAAVGERLGIAPGRIVNCIDRYGNTSAATIPLALADALDAGRLNGGERVLLAAFGSGLTWSATVLEWGPDGASGAPANDGGTR